MNKKTSLCFTGHRTEKLPKTQGELEKLKQRVWDEIDKAVSEYKCQYKNAQKL